MARTMNGTVVSANSDKTIVVRVDRQARHPIYNKAYKISKKYHVHDEDNTAVLNDVVTFQECAPKSRLKRWNLVEITKKADVS